MDSFDSYESGNEEKNHEGSFERTDRKINVDGKSETAFEKNLNEIQMDVKQLKDTLSSNDTKMNLNLSNNKEFSKRETKIKPNTNLSLLALNIRKAKEIPCLLYTSPSPRD